MSNSNEVSGSYMMQCVERSRPITIGQKTCTKEAGYTKSTYTGSKLSKGSSSDAGNEHRSALTLYSFKLGLFFPFLLFLKLPGDPDIFWVDRKSLTVKISFGVFSKFL